jgi:hypothetical protein
MFYCVGYQIQMYGLVYLARGGNAVVEQWHHHPKVEGSSPAVVGTGREKWQKMFLVK